MKRPLAALVAALLTTTVASAQSYPGDPGVGVERGIQELNNSGQVGTATLFRRDPNTRLVVILHGTIPGRTQSVRVYRGTSCDDLGTAAPTYFLTDMQNGASSSIVKAPISKLLSGNYNVVVFSSTAPGAQATACGHLYAS
jgi:hypothetical protein